MIDAAVNVYCIVTGSNQSGYPRTTVEEIVVLYN